MSLDHAKGDRVIVDGVVYTVVDFPTEDTVRVQYRDDLPPRVRQQREVRTLGHALTDAWALVHVISREVGQDSLTAAADALRHASDEYDAAQVAADSTVTQGVPS